MHEWADSVWHSLFVCVVLLDTAKLLVCSQMCAVKISERSQSCSDDCCLIKVLYVDQADNELWTPL